MLLTFKTIMIWIRIRIRVWEYFNPYTIPLLGKMPFTDEKTLAGLLLNFGVMTNKLSKTIDKYIDYPFTLSVA